MSYCRWSTDDFKCDLYCYCSDRGYETHVATRRRSYITPPPPFVAWRHGEDNAAWFERHRVISDMEEGRDYTLEPIGLPCDGQSFTDDSLEEFLARVRSLRAMGYACPDELEAEIEAEITEEAARR